MRRNDGQGRDISIRVRHQSQPKQHPQCRSGVSRLDVSTSIAMIALLFAVSIPACNSRRAAVKRIECLNNLKNIALATHNFASGRGGALPLLDDSSYGWPIRLLPALDAAALYREYTDETKTEKTSLWLKLYTCPDDSNNSRTSQGLSYVANAGYGNFRVDQTTGAISEVGTHPAETDWNNDDRIDELDRDVSRASGVFWRKHDDDFQMNLEYIERADGMSQTLLFTENLNARNFASRNTMDIAFVIGRDVLGLGAQSNGSSPLQIQTTTLGAFRINGNDGSLPGQSPVPSSGHSGIVNVAFCDGRANAISESIDPRVYARLMTPNGEAFGQLPVKEDDF